MKTSILFGILSAIALTNANIAEDADQEELFLRTPAEIIMEHPEPVTEIATTDSKSGSDSTTDKNGQAPPASSAKTGKINLLTTTKRIDNRMNIMNKRKEVKVSKYDVRKN